MIWRRARKLRRLWSKEKLARPERPSRVFCVCFGALAGGTTVAKARSPGSSRCAANSTRAKTPIDERNREQEAASIAAAALTFEKAARQVHEELKPGWRNEKHAADWIRSLEAYVFPTLGATAFDAVTPADWVDVLRPI